MTVYEDNNVGTTMDSYQLNYDFKIEPENAGYFTITSDEGDITMLAKFVVDGEIHENLFELKHDGLNVTRIRLEIMNGNPCRIATQTVIHPQPILYCSQG